MGAVQLVYLGGALRGGPDAGLAALEQTFTSSAVEPAGTGTLLGLLAAAVLPCALMVRARAAGARPGADLTLGAIFGLLLALCGAIGLGLLAIAPRLRTPSAPTHPLFEAALGVAAGVAIVVVALGWALVPAWAATFWLCDRVEAWWPDERAPAP